MSDLIYISGPPGAGKSTLMAELTRGCLRSARRDPFAFQVLYDMDGMVYGAELGRQRPDFPGTDTLSMNVAPLAREWVGTRPYDLLLGEGDRLAISSFLQAGQDAGYTVTLVHVTAPAEVLDARCAARGSAQNVTWRNGRATKAERLTEWARDHGCTVQVVHQDDGATPERLAGWLRGCIPALAVLP